MGQGGLKPPVPETRLEAKGKEEEEEERGGKDEEKKKKVWRRREKKEGVPLDSKPASATDWLECLMF